MVGLLKWYDWDELVEENSRIFIPSSLHFSPITSTDLAFIMMELTRLETFVMEIISLESFDYFILMQNSEQSITDRSVKLFCHYHNTPFIVVLKNKIYELFGLVLSIEFHFYLNCYQYRNYRPIFRVSKYYDYYNDIMGIRICIVTYKLAFSLVKVLCHSKCFN